jgi:TM2 domain-containing membrane protein YozV
MKILASAVASFIIPGLGQLFNGRFRWAMAWFIFALIIPGLSNVLSACHAVFITAK